MSRTIAIGDIHGCATALQKLLDEISPQPDDVIVGLGDYVDRGMESSRVLEILVDLVTKCRFIPLIGNHEIMMFKAMQSKQDFDFWFQHGGSTTIASYGGRIQNVPQHHMTFLSHCQRFYEDERYFFIHANYHPDLGLMEQPDEIIFWHHINEVVRALIILERRRLSDTRPKSTAQCETWIMFESLTPSATVTNG